MIGAALLQRQALEAQPLSEGFSILSAEHTEMGTDDGLPCALGCRWGQRDLGTGAAGQAEHRAKEGDQHGALPACRDALISSYRRLNFPCFQKLVE